MADPSPYRGRPERLLVVAARPRDADDELAGSVASWVGDGSVCQLVCCTSGDTDGEILGADPLAVAATREHEQRTAANGIGYEAVIFLHRPDGAVANDLALREQLVRIVREFRPDTVAHPDPRVVIGPTGHINDADRRATGFAVIDAIGPARHAMAFKHLLTSDGLQPWSVEHLLLTGSPAPALSVDIGPTLDRKIDALLAHQGQGREATMVEAAARAEAARIGASTGVTAAEAFSIITLDHT